MTRLINAAGPYAKAIVCAAAIVLALAAEAAGVDLGLDVDSLWQQIGAVLVPSLLVYAVPNTARREMP